jgi:hypothetical protein
MVEVRIKAGVFPVGASTFEPWTGVAEDFGAGLASLIGVNDGLHDGGVRGDCALTDVADATEAEHLWLEGS